MDLCISKIWIHLDDNLNFTKCIFPPYELFERPLIFDMINGNEDDTVYQTAIAEIDK